MSYDYSENILVQESAGHLLENELGWEVALPTTRRSWATTARLAARATGRFCWPGIFGRLCCA